MVRKEINNSNSSTKLVNAKYVDQYYGKSQFNKEGLFSLRVLSFKLKIPLHSDPGLFSELNIDNKINKKNNELIAKILDDRKSQSQSSSQCKANLLIDRFSNKASRKVGKRF